MLTQPQLRRLLRNCGKSLAIGGLGYCVLNSIANALGEFVICSGPSMLPTIQEGDVLVGERLPYIPAEETELKNGDIVGFLHPNNHRLLLCKRLAAKEGEVVNHHLLPVNRVPLGHVWVRGDNAAASSDSRHFGPIPEGLIQ
ncbi:unnamed protein product, partial [Mesorhabditis spiculigera]